MSSLMSVVVVLVDEVSDVVELPSTVTAKLPAASVHLALIPCPEERFGELLHPCDSIGP
jgi:hypothetical protein